MKFARLLCAAALLGSAASANAQVQVNVNPTSVLNNGYFRNVSSIGWYFTPTSTFFLNAIQTRFNPSAGTNVDRTVTAELWTKTPATGGALLRSGNFQSNSALGFFGGGSFSNFLLQSGVQYFIGFRNLQGLGHNFTHDPLAQSLGPPLFSLGPVFSDDQYERQAPNHPGDDAKPSIRLIGQVSTVPEPVTMTLLATGLAVMGGATLLRRRARRKSME